MIHEIRVIFGDTDQMGIVYYANYLRYFESARGALLRARGHSYKEMESWGVALPVIEAFCKYKASAHYEDLLQVHITLEGHRAASLRFRYKIFCGETLLVEGYTLHACVDPETGKPWRIPPRLEALFDEEPG